MIKTIATIALCLFIVPILIGQNSGKIASKSLNSPVLTIVDTPPEFVGGDLALYTFVYQKLKFPSDSEMAECTVYIEFVVNEDGSLSNIGVKKGFSNAYNEEAIKVVAAMPKWRSGKHEGQARRVARVLPIRFKLF
jgi:periplasmic protein TonB